MSDIWSTTKLCDVSESLGPYFNGFSGLAVDNDGIVYFTTSDHNIYQMSQYHKNPIPKCAIDMERSQFYGIVYDGKNNLYCCDKTNHRILSYSTSTGDLIVFAGTGRCGVRGGSIKDAQFNGPFRITIDGNGDLYVSGTKSLQKINMKEQTVSVIFHNTETHRDRNLSDALNQPFDTAISSDGTMYIADCGAHMVRQIKDGIVSNVAGEPNKHGHPSEHRVMFPKALVLVEGSLFVGDRNGISRIDLTQPGTLSARTIFDLNTFSMCANINGNELLVGGQHVIWKLKMSWKWRRWLWIGHLKENPSACLLATLPKDVIKEIAQFI